MNNCFYSWVFTIVFSLSIYAQQDKTQLSIERFDSTSSAFHDSLAHVYEEQAAFEKALLHYKSALNLLEKQTGVSYSDRIRQHHNIAFMYYRLGDYDQALGHYKQEEAIRLEQEEESLELAQTYNDIGSSYDQKGDYEEALLYSGKALSIQRNLLKDENHPEVAKTYTAMGFIYVNKKDHERGLQYHQKALDIFLKHYGENHTETAKAYNNLAFAWGAAGDAEKQLLYYQKTLDIRLSVKGNRSFIGQSYNNLAVCYYRQGKQEKALSYYKKALNIWRETLGDKHRNVAKSCINIGGFYAYRKQWDQALFYFHQVLLTLTDHQDTNVYSHPDIENSRDPLTLLKAMESKMRVFYEMYWEDQKKTIALTYAAETADLAIKLMDQLRFEYSSHSKIYLAPMAAQLYEGALQINYSLYLATEDTSYLHKTFSVAEKSKAVVLRAAIDEVEARQFSRIPDSMLKREKYLRMDMTYYREQIIKCTDDKKQLYRDALFASSREHEKIIQTLEEQYPRYYRLKHTRETASVKDIQASLDEETVLIEYMVVQNSYYIFLIAQKEFQVLSLRKDVNFEKTIDAYRKSLKKYGRLHDFAEKSYQAYRLLIASVETYLYGKKNLKIIADDILHEIPFDALIARMPREETMDFSALDFLIKHHTISYHYSATLWRNSADSDEKRVGWKYDLLGFAPVFTKGEGLVTDAAFIDQSRGAILDMEHHSLKPLKGSEQELKMIVDAWRTAEKKVKEYFYREASEATFKAMTDSARVIHLATHGFADRERPLFSCIAFAQPDSTKRSSDDGFLYTGEIYNLDIHAELVVLSSCQSGAGKLVKGEGVMALTRGFLYHEVPNVLVALWSVSDFATKELMVAFYRDVIQHESYPQALRKAKLSLLDNPRTAHPKWWSAFVLISAN